MKRLSQIGRTIIIFVSILMGVLSIPVGVSAQTAAVPDLFIETANSPVVAQSLDPSIMRSRYVEVGIDVLDRARDAIHTTTEDYPLFSIQIQLFSDADYTVNLTRVENTVMGGYVLRGSIEGIPGSEVHLAVQEDVLIGSVMLPGADYHIEYVEGSLHVIEQINPAAIPPIREPLLPPDFPEMVSADASYGLDDDGSQVDVMVVYTTNARERAGSTSSINARIASEIDIINTGYQNSGINHRMRLVHTVEVNYDEYAVDWANNLYDVTYTNDGKIDQVHTLRDQYNADLVILITEKYGPYCGIAWVLQNAQLYYDYIGFSVVSYFCMGSGNYTAAHETGHNMGAAHDRNTGGVSGVYDYARGYQSSNFYTIMAYDNGTQNRINHWSNPGVSYNGIPTGVDYQAANSADNVMALNQTALVVAQFRDAPPPAAPSNLSANAISRTQINLSWTDKCDEETRFYVERAPGGTGSWEEIANLPANSISFEDTGHDCGTAFRYRVRAYGPGGYSTYTDEINAQTRACINTPQNLTALSVSKSQIRLDWEDMSGNEDGFKVERRVAGQITWSEEGAVEPDVETFLDSGLTCETTYQYRVYGFNEDGPSEYSNITSANTALCPPTDLSGITLSQSRISLEWLDNSGSEDNYLLERSLSGLNDWQSLDSLPANTETFEDTLLACGTTYDYRVGAQKSGELDSEKFQTTVSTNACTPTPAPQGLSATPLSGTLVRLNWQDVLDDETSYQVDRRNKGQASWTPVGATAQNYTTFVDRYLEWGQEYEYRVLAVNEYGATAGTVVGVTTYPYGVFLPLGN